MTYLRKTKEDAETEINRIEDNMKEQSTYLDSLEERSSLGTCCIPLQQGTFVRPFLVLVFLMTVGMQYTGAPPLAFYLVQILQESNVPK